MNGRVIHCKAKNCQKLLAKDANLSVGDSIKIKCPHCGRINCICAKHNGFEIVLNDDEENRAVFLNY